MLKMNKKVEKRFQRMRKELDKLGVSYALFVDDGDISSCAYDVKDNSNFRQVIDYYFETFQPEEHLHE